MAADRQQRRRCGLCFSCSAPAHRATESGAIGDAVMQRLRTIDQVAYVRFASVYKEFRDVSEFMQEISSLPKPKK